MLIAGFGIDGWVRPGRLGRAPVVLHRRGLTEGGPDPVHAAVHIVQREPGDPRDALRPADRLALAGWVDTATCPVPAAGDSWMRALQDALDHRGAEVVRDLRGDLVLVHVAADGRRVQVLRTVEAMIPVFWRRDGAVVRFAADPLRLFPGGPRRCDVDFDVLPMVLSERGVPEDRCWFAGVSRLPNGSRLTLAAGEPHPVVDGVDELRPWGEPPRTLAEAADGVRERLARSCDRMLSGGAGGLLTLSGGMDSGAVAVELARHAPGATALHYTLESFPGFDQDREAAAETAAATGLRFVPYGMEKHTMPGGDYVSAGASTMPPQTHVPLVGIGAAAAAAEADGARFVLSGLLSDQAFAHDLHTAASAGGVAAMANPLVAGEPPWQAIAGLARASFGASGGSGVRETGRYLAALWRRDPTIALPARDVVAHPIGLTPDAADRVTEGLRTAARRAHDELAAAAHRNGRGSPPEGLTSMFFIRQMLGTVNLAASWLNHGLPRRRFLRTPYADRDLLEYALTLPAHHRVGRADGMTLDKLALRTAYARRGLPHGVGGRMQQARIGAIPAVYVAQNTRACLDLLGEGSILRSAGILDGEFVDRLTPENIHRNGEEVARLCAIESWLQALAP